MKKAYVSPKAEKMVFDYTETVIASSGNAYQLYVDGYTGCRETPTDQWYVMENDTDGSCMKML